MYAAAGKTTLTTMVQIIPTRAHNRLKEGTQMAVNRANMVRTSLMAAEAS
jgi:hypothetical protein